MPWAIMYMMDFFDLDQINLNVLPAMPRAARLVNMQGVFYSKAGALYAMHHKGGRIYFTGATAYANSINTHQYNLGLP